VTSDQIFGALVLIALPAAVAYPLIYGTQVRWWHDWIGRALLIKACGVADLLLVWAAYQVFGPDYWARDTLRITGIALVAIGVWLALIAMIRAVFQRRV
jgi:hypothetical protein